MQNKKEYICPVCGKPYEYQLKTWIDENGNKHCLHDDEFIFDNLHFTNYEKKISRNLPKGKVLAKGSDGITRVCDVKKK